MIEGLVWLTKLSDVSWMYVKEHTKDEIIIKFEKECLDLQEAIEDYRQGKIGDAKFSNQLASLLFMAECVKKIVGYGLTSRMLDIKIIGAKRQLDLKGGD